MLVVNMSPDGVGLKDSELLTETLRMYRAANGGPNPDVVTWEVDRLDVVFAVQWLLKRGFMDPRLVRLQDHGREIRLDEEFDPIDQCHPDPTLHVAFDADPGELRRRFTWFHGDDEVSWLKVP